MNACFGEGGSAQPRCWHTAGISRPCQVRLECLSNAQMRCFAKNYLAKHFVGRDDMYVVHLV